MRCRSLLFRLGSARRDRKALTFFETPPPVAFSDLNLSSYRLAPAFSSAIPKPEVTVIEHA